MRALLQRDTSGPDALEVGDIPEPEAGDGVVVDVAAAGVSFPDLLLSRGQYQLRPDPPFVPGAEAAGTVVSAPPESGLQPGQRVAAMVGVGAWAERIAVPPAMVFPVADALSDEQAAGYLMNYHTAHFAFERRGRLQPGETVLVHGAGGGLGTACVQVATGMGARVIASASSPAKADAARECGATDVVDPTGDWLAEVKELTGGRGADLIADPVGGDRFDDSVRALAPEGRLLVLGFTEGAIPQVKVNRLLLRNVDIVGVGWGAFLGHDPQELARGQQGVDRLIDSGHVRPLVGAVYPFDQAPRALHDLDERRAVGKLVLRLRN